MLPEALVDRDLHGQFHKASRTIPAIFQALRKALYGSKVWLDKLDLTYELNGHNGCVNALSWSQEGEYLVSGSDDYRLYIWDAYNKFAVRKVLDTGHRGNIFSAKFMPHTGNRKIISCAGDYYIKLSEVEYTPERQAPGSTKRTWYCHRNMTKRLVTEDNPNTFLSCSEDGDVRHHDLRISHPCPTSPRQCPKPLISYRPYEIELTTLTMAKANPMYLIVGGAHPHAFLHDRRMVGRDLRQEWGNLSWKADVDTQCVRRFSPHGKFPTSRRSVHITACKFSEARPTDFVGSWSADNVYSFNIHDPIHVERESTANSKTSRKPNPTESSTNNTNIRTKRKRVPTNAAEEAPLGTSSSGSSLDTGRPAPPLRESSVSAETSTSLTAMSTRTVVADSISGAGADSLGRQLTVIRRLFFTPTAECTQQTFLMAHESVVSLLEDMRMSMHSGSPEFAPQREESIRFVTAIGVVCRVVALHLEWQSPADSMLLVPIRNWEHYIRRSWDGWTIQFIRLICGWFDDVISPNHILRELSTTRAFAPSQPLVAVGGDEILFEGLSEMSTAFERFFLSPEKSMEEKRFWGLEVLRALILLLGDGINYSFIEGAFSPVEEEMEDEEEEEEEEGQGHGREYEAETLLDVFEAAQPPGIHGDQHEESDEDEEDDTEDEETYMLGGGDEEEDEVPLFFFPSRRGRRHREMDAAKDVPVVSHRKEYSGHCNVQTIKDVNYFGLDDEYVMSGSDDGILFIWDRKTSGIVQLLKADTQVTNVMTGHPYHPIIAASGIDHTVKIFSPEGLGKGLLSRQSLHDEYKIRTRNEVSRTNELHGTFLTRDMLEALAMNIRRGRIVRAGGGDVDGPGECHTQ